eukprot:1048332-Rhodomonas_salina.3
MLVDFIVTGKRSTNIAEAFYHALAMLLGGEDQEWISWPGHQPYSLRFCYTCPVLTSCTGLPGRVLRLGMLFVVLIVGATYTGSIPPNILRLDCPDMCNAATSKLSRLPHSPRSSFHLPHMPRHTTHWYSPAVS